MRKLIVGGLTGALAMLLFASTALAASHNPKGEYAGFKECPLNRATITDCVLSVSNGGFFTIGKKTVPLKNPVTLQGGFEGEGAAVKFYGAENGDTLSKTPQPVPGGLLGITAPTWWPKFIQDWFNEQISKGFTGVNATVELTGPTKGLTNVKLSTENLLTRKGTALGLPAKIHLENAILGSSCYIGSDSKPVQVNLTTGASGALEGSVGTVGFNEEFTITKATGTKLVDNTFAAPATSGCGGLFSLFVDPLVSSVIGVPAGSGENSATLEGSLEDGYGEAVRLFEE
jgi:hypothetical protein